MPSSNETSRLAELLAKWSTPEAWQEFREADQAFRGARFLASIRWRAVADAKAEGADAEHIAKMREDARDFDRRKEIARLELVALQFETDELRALLPEELRKSLPEINWFGETAPDVPAALAALQSLRSQSERNQTPGQ